MKGATEVADLQHFKAACKEGISGSSAEHWGGFEGSVSFTVAEERIIENKMKVSNSALKAKELMEIWSL